MGCYCNNNASPYLSCIWHSPNRYKGCASKPVGLSFKTLSSVCKDYRPNAVVLEKIFVNRNPASTLKLGLARGVCFLTPGLFCIPVFEYSATRIKNTLLGYGHATKQQIGLFIRATLNISQNLSEDESDAFSAALVHYYFCQKTVGAIRNQDKMNPSSSR